MAGIFVLIKPKCESLCSVQSWQRQTQTKSSVFLVRNEAYATMVELGENLEENDEGVISSI